MMTRDVLEENGIEYVGAEVASSVLAGMTSDSAFQKASAWVQRGGAAVAMALRNRVFLHL
jgi:hypothetical protein